ncbi:MAG: hypothetical protein IT289_13510 [Oligoflexia bacterium]|nr:hypothetical protein [Oligoflexia bacterium]
MIHKLLVAFVLTYACSAFGGLGYLNAPACLYDLDRQFTVVRAQTHVANAYTIWVANGRTPLFGQALSNAQYELDQAAKNLEQIMNYGILTFASGQYGRCIPCDPNKGTLTNKSFIQVSWDLVTTHRLIAGNSNSTAYLTFVETTNHHIQNYNYCGHSAVYQTDVSRLVGRWTLAQNAPVQRLLCPSLELSGAYNQWGRIVNYCFGSEKNYWWIGYDLVFIGTDGQVSSVLRQSNLNYWEGRSRLYSGNLVLTRNSDPVPTPTPNPVNPGPTDHFIFVNNGHYVCCKGTGQDNPVYPYQKVGETPLQIHIGRASSMNANSLLIIERPFATRKDAEDYLCRNYKWISGGHWARNYARVEGYLVANSPCRLN